MNGGKGMTAFRKGMILLAAMMLLVGAPTRAAHAQGDGEEELQVHITQVDSSQFPEVEVYVSVTDPEGEPVAVSPERIVLRENEAIVKPDEVVARGEAGPLSTLLIFDVSGSMNSAGKLETAKEAAKAYLETMRLDDQVGLLTFNTEVNYVQPLTSNQEALRAVIDELTAEEDTAMYDALVEGEELLGSVEGRKAVIVLTDGMDNRSEFGLGDVLDRLGPGGLSISTVGLGDPKQLDATTAGLDVPALEQLASQAGGQYAYANDAPSLTMLYERLARALQSEFLLRYTSPAALRDGLRRSLTVRLRDVESTVQPAAYNPGGLVPEVSQPAPWPTFAAGLLGLALLLFVPGLLRRLLPIGRSDGESAELTRKPRIRLKD
jgi:VWFA-related protein